MNTGLSIQKDVQAAINDDTILIAIMHANNEVGTIQPIDEIGEIAKKKDISFHTDAAQSCGKIEVDVEKLQVDLLTIAGHKIYAPKGVGALYVRKRTAIDNFVHGAGQERGRRVGTENIPYIVGLGIACNIDKVILPAFSRDVKMLRDSLYKDLLEGIGPNCIKLNGHPDMRLTNTLNVSIRGTIGEMLLSSIHEIAASTAAACYSGSFEPSKVLLGLSLSREEALEALRLLLIAIIMILPLLLLLFLDYCHLLFSSCSSLADRILVETHCVLLFLPRFLPPRNPIHRSPVLLLSSFCSLQFYHKYLPWMLEDLKSAAFVVVFCIHLQP
jgi:cysteine sulfinate desulfinase/cysteine desulfurase-like protein